MLKEQEISEKQEKLHEILIEISLIKLGIWNNINDSEQYAIRLQDIYADDFRHQYNKFFEVVKKVCGPRDRNKNTDIEVFKYNLKMLKEFIMQKAEIDQSYKELSKPVGKLYDHIMLEISRWEFFFGDEGRMTALQKKYNKLQDEASNLQVSQQNLEQKLQESSSKLQTDFVAILAIFVAILAIFAAVVMAFFSGSNYLFSTISAIKDTPLNSLVAIATVCGIVLINTLFILMHFVGKLINKNLDTGYLQFIIINILLLAILITSRCTCLFK